MSVSTDVYQYLMLVRANGQLCLIKNKQMVAALLASDCVLGVCMCACVCVFAHVYACVCVCARVYACECTCK